MKKILAVTLALASTGSAFAGQSLMDSYGNRAQRQEAATNVPAADMGVRHMVEFNAQSLPSLVLGFKRDKTPGRDASSGTDLNLGVNYAYGIHRFLQAGFRFNYDSGLSGANDEENVSAQVGIIVNSNSDFTQAAYLSAYIGAGYAQDFGAGTRDDLRLGTIALGKRIPLDRFGIKHVVYSPEVALTMVNSTTDENFDYRQALELRVLQFSAFF